VPERSPIEVFLAFLRLGLISFGGPIAHLSYFREEFVRRRKWLDEAAFAQIVALCQFLPGPASSQVGMIIGLLRAGALGSALAWIAFTLPSAIVLVAFALGIARIPNAAHQPWIHGLLIAAVAVVVVAVSSMMRNLCPDVPRKSVAFIAAAIILLLPPNAYVQLLMILAGAVFGRVALMREAEPSTRELPIRGNRTMAIACGVLFVVLLAGLPAAQRFVTAGPFKVFAAFYEAGALVFGGGHVVLPLLQARVVPPGWIGSGDFLAGYGLAQAVPGPLFTFAAYLGAAMHGPVHGIPGAGLALLSIYLPSFLLIAAVLPFWNDVTRYRGVVAALQGVNASVVGLLLAALYQPVWVSAIRVPGDAALALLAFLLLDFWKTPPWAVVVLSAIAATLLHLQG
jgi:chromate transporter